MNRLFIGLVFLIACGGSEEMPTVNSEICEHMKEGPFSDITAVATSSASPPSAAVEHTRVNIALIDVGGMNGGFVNFEVGDAGDFVIGLSTSVPLEVKSGTGMMVDFESSTPNADCPAEAPVQHTIELEVGTYSFEFGPTAETSVGLVHEEAEGHEHQE